jgi:hypothetical protein
MRCIAANEMTKPSPTARFFVMDIAVAGCGEASEE